MGRGKGKSECGSRKVKTEVGRREAELGMGKAELVERKIFDLNDRIT